jgi:hypothetical protein
LRQPVAALFTLRGQPTGIHGAGPFWQSFDGSKVIGTAVESDTERPGPANIAWLKVEKKTVEGTGVFSNVTFIQRIDTKGGVAPKTCGAPTVSVGYSTNYVFWAPK